MNTPATSRSVRRRFRTLVGSVALATAALAAGGASSADAAVITPSDASASTWFSCNPQLHTINYHVTIRPARGRTTQAAAFRIRVYDLGTGHGFWTAWTRVTAPSQTMHFVSMFDARGRYMMRMQYGWWDGRAWFVTGEWIRSYSQQTLYGGHFPQRYCAV